MLEAVLENSNRLVLEDCEANIEIKTYNQYKIVSLRKTSIHDNKDGGLLSRHNKNMTNLLILLKNLFIITWWITRDVKRVKRDSKVVQLKVYLFITEIVADTNELHKEIELENEVVNLLVAKVKILHKLSI